MKVAAHKATDFIKNPDKNIIAALIYGPDTGQVSLRAKQLAEWAADDLNDPFNVAEISTEALKESPSIIHDEMAAMSLMGGRRLIRFKNAGNADTKYIEQALKQPTEQKDAFLIVTAGDLKPGSLRRLFENTTSCAALPCYVEDIRGLTRLVDKELSARGLSAGSGVATTIAMQCQGDQLIVISEIEKLSLYLGDKKHVSLGDVEKSIGQNTESSIDDICNAIALGNHRLVEQHLHKAFQQGLVPIMLLRAVQRFFSRIHLIQGLVSEGQTQDQALKQLRPPVFFKQLPMFKQFLSKFNNSRSTVLWRIMNELYDAELKCKSTGANAELMCSRYLMKIASMSK